MGVKDKTSGAPLRRCVTMDPTKGNGEAGWVLPTEDKRAQSDFAGYGHAEYARSLAAFGTPRYLVRSGGWALERKIRGTRYRDSMGCYPLFVCRDWGSLGTDIQEVGPELVSLSLVADPFGDHSPELLRRTFPDVCFPFKSHFIVDLEQRPDSFISPHHKRNVRRALERVSVGVHAAPITLLEEWADLYAILIRRHNIRGIPAFSKSAFALQLATPGVVAIRATERRETVGMTLWYVQGTVAYYHLSAYNAAGYESRASFALFSTAIQYFADCGLRWLNLGGGAGLSAHISDGLGRFKQGWATGTRTAFFCGKILDHERYVKLSRVSNPRSKYFPLYRHGEFPDSA